MIHRLVLWGLELIDIIRTVPLIFHDRASLLVRKAGSDPTDLGQTA
jgi:hypothetical protein